MGLTLGSSSLRILGGCREKKKGPLAFNLWDKEGEGLPHYHIPPPKMKKPGHAASYNPPAEYLPTEEEKEAWALMEPEERPYEFIPAKARRADTRRSSMNNTHARTRPTLSTRRSHAHSKNHKTRIAHAL